MPVLSVAARYVVAADGGRTVGASLGVRLQGTPGLVDITTAYFSADLSAWRHDGAIITWFLSPYRLELSCTLLEMGPTWGKGCEEWGLHFIPGDLARFDERAVVPRIREVLGLPALDLTVHKVTRWTVEGVLADRYRVGRVLLVGGAAHRQPPTTGLGLNSGIQDAHNLAWKLAAILSGRASDSLLDTYEAERRPVGRNNVDWALSAWFHHKVINDAAIGLGPHIPPQLRTEVFAGISTRPRSLRRPGRGPRRSSAPTAQRVPDRRPPESLVGGVCRLESAEASTIPIIWWICWSKFRRVAELCVIQFSARVDGTLSVPSASIAHRLH